MSKHPDPSGWCRLWLAAALWAIAAAASAAAAATHSVTTVAEGTRFATPCYVQDSGASGPTVLIVGGVHGNEPAGASAADQIRHWPITRGKLIVLPRANVPALAAKTRLIPDVEKESGNLNRNFPKAGNPGPAVGEPAAAIWKCVQQHRPTWLVDLHEGFGVRQDGSKSVGSSAIVFRSPEADKAAALMLEAVNKTIGEEKQKFVRLGPPVDGSLARAAGEYLGARAMILETTTKNQPLSQRIRQHRIMVHRLLVHLGMLDESVEVDSLANHQPAPGQTRVALYDAPLPNTLPCGCDKI